MARKIARNRRQKLLSSLLASVGVGVLLAVGGVALPLFPTQGAAASIPADCTTAHTAEPSTWAGKGGASQDPRPIATKDDLVYLSLNQSQENRDANYILTADIDLAGCNWIPIDGFAGVFDGAFQAVSNLYVDRQVYYTGFFGQVFELAVVKNLGLIDATVKANTSPFFFSDSGVLAASNSGSITKVYVTGQLSSSFNYAGGLVGINRVTGAIDQSWSGVDVTSTAFSALAGGLVAQNWGGEISQSFSTGTVSADRPGGLVGAMSTYAPSGTGASLTDSYSASKVTGAFSPGGLVHSLSAASTVTNSFYDQTLSGLSDTGKGEPKTSAQMRTAETFTAANWAITDGSPAASGDAWAISPSLNSGYPILAWQTRNAFCPPLVSGVHEVTTPQQLAAVGAQGVGTGYCQLGASYAQSGDIDLSTFGPWSRLGETLTGFSGQFDGQGHTITGLTINGTASEDSLGLFGRLDGLAVVEDVRLVSATVVGDAQVGALVGVTDFQTEIRRSSVEGSTITGNTEVGGLVGRANGTIRESYVNADISERNAALSANEAFGGLVGLLYRFSSTGGKIVDSYAVGTVAGKTKVGGLVGASTGGSIENSWSAMAVTAETTVKGGMVGWAETTTSPSFFTTDVLRSYYDSDLSGQLDTGAGIPKTTTEMQNAQTYSGWALAQKSDPVGPPSEVWGMTSIQNRCYPFLWWEAASHSECFTPPATPTTPESTTTESTPRSSRDDDIPSATVEQPVSVTASQGTPPVTALPEEEGVPDVSPPSPAPSGDSDPVSADPSEPALAPDGANPDTPWSGLWWMAIIGLLAAIFIAAGVTLLRRRV